MSERAHQLIAYLERKIESARQSGQSHATHGTKDRSHKCTIRIVTAQEIIGELRRLAIRREITPKVRPKEKA